jgi:hypothetical protein
MTEASTDPSTSPRRALGAIAITHASAALQMQPDATPWMNRKPPSTAMLEPNPNGAIAAVKSSRPATVVRRTPALVAIQPPRSEPGTVPAG